MAGTVAGAAGGWRVGPSSSSQPLALALRPTTIGTVTAAARAHRFGAAGAASRPWRSLAVVVVASWLAVVSWALTDGLEHLTSGGGQGRPYGAEPVAAWRPACAFLGPVEAARPSLAESSMAPSQGRRAAALSPLVGVVFGLGGGSDAQAKSFKETGEKIKQGYKNLCYLLANWDEETTNQSDGSRKPDAVRSYLGLRSTEDPLFNLDKVLTQVTDQVNPDMADDFSEAIDVWSSTVAEANSAAFVSSFGEFNPGGGADQVLKFLEKSKASVVKCKGVLEKIGKALNLDLKA